MKQKAYASTITVRAFAYCVHWASLSEQRRGNVHTQCFSICTLRRKNRFLMCCTFEARISPTVLLCVLLCPHMQFRGVESLVTSETFCDCVCKAALKKTDKLKQNACTVLN